MSSRNRDESPDGVLTNLILVGLVGLVGVAALLRIAGAVAAYLSGHPQPTIGISAGLGVVTNARHPGIVLGMTDLNAILYWFCVAALAAVAGTMGWGAWRIFHRGFSVSAGDPSTITGLSSRADIARTASQHVLLSRAATLRPSIRHPRPTDVGYLIGRCHGRAVWVSVEDSILLLGPPRSGKGAHVVINAILDAPGAVVATSTRPDNLATTIQARMDKGPVAVFDPQQLAAGIPAGLRWSPVRGCEQPLTAMIRATGLAAGTGLARTGVENGGFWEGKTRTALQALLHAAALDHRTATDVFRWTLDPAAARDAVTVLTHHPRAAAGWAESLEAMIDADPRTRDSIWQGVSLALSALADPRVLNAVSPADQERFDPETFLRERGTLYLLATGAGAGASSGLVAAFVEDLVETARRMAARSPGARLDPPVLLSLDEIGNLAPLPSLPTLMAEGGGTGITPMPVLQSMAQARERWGDHAATAIWDASIAKIILGGGSNSTDLRDLSTLIGDRDESMESFSVSDHGARSRQQSTRRVPIMPPDVIRTLPYGTALVLLRSGRPILTRMRPWTSRPDARTLRTRRSAAEATLLRGPMTHLNHISTHR
jgi:type IV secretion system protein VirD4